MMSEDGLGEPLEAELLTKIEDLNRQAQEEMESLRAAEVALQEKAQRCREAMLRVGEALTRQIDTSLDRLLAMLWLQDKWSCFHHDPGKPH